MLLLDHNLPHQLRELLAEYGLEAETARFRGWEDLRNGELVAAAHAAGIQTIFTRDNKFGESASKSLARFPIIAIVVIGLPQRSWKLYRNAFQVAWEVGFAIIRVGEAFTTDEVVFAEKGDLLPLGARTLERLNLVVNSRDKKLVAAGPIPAA